MQYQNEETNAKFRIKLVTPKEKKHTSKSLLPCVWLSNGKKILNLPTMQSNTHNAKQSTRCHHIIGLMHCKKRDGGVFWSKFWSCQIWIWGGAFWSVIPERGFPENLDKNLLFSQNLLVHHNSLSHTMCVETNKSREGFQVTTLSDEDTREKTTNDLLGRLWCFGAAAGPYMTNTLHATLWLKAMRFKSTSILSKKCIQITRVAMLLISRKVIHFFFELQAFRSSTCCLTIFHQHYASKTHIWGSTSVLLPDLDVENTLVFWKSDGSLINMLSLLFAT